MARCRSLFLISASWLVLVASPAATALSSANASLPYADSGLPAADAELRRERLQRLTAGQRQPLQQAWQALEQGNTSSAQQLLQPLLAPTPSAETLLLLAEVALQQREWPRAALLYAAAVAATNDELVLLSGRERLAQLQASWADDPQWQPQPVSSGLRLPLRFLLSNQVVPRPHRYLNVASNGQLRWRVEGQQRFATLLGADQLIAYDSVEQRLLTRPLPGSGSELQLTRHFAYAWRHDSNLLWRWQLPGWQPLAPTALSRSAADGWSVANGAGVRQPESEQAWVVVRQADELQLINADGGEPLRLAAPAQGANAALSLSGDGRQLLLYLPLQPQLQWWDLATGRQLASLSLPPQLAGLPAHWARLDWAAGYAELHFGGAQQPLALRFGTGQPLSYQALSNPGQLDEGAQALRLEARADGWQLANGQRLPSAPVTLALTAHVLQYDPAGGPSRLYDHHGQLLRQLDFSLPALRVNSRLQLQPLGEGQLLAIQSGYPPFVVELSDGRISRALVAESDQPLVMAQGLSDGHVLAVHDTGAGDGELFIWQPPHLPAAVAVLAAQLASRSGESSADYTSRLSGISAGYCGRVYPLHYDNISGVYSLEWQGAEVTLVVAAHARPGRQQRLELCGSLHPLGTDQLELRDISLRAR